MVKNKKDPKLVDHVSDSSDEEIDEDLAFNSDDERMYGYHFNSKPSSSSRKSKKDTGSSDDDEDDDDDGSMSSEASYSGDDSSTGIASDDEDEDGDGGQFMLDLLNNLDKKNDDNKKERRRDVEAAMANSSKMPESEFSSSAVKSSNLTLDQLMSGISDTKGFSSVKQTMKDISADQWDDDGEKKLETTKVPVAKIVSDRVERKVHYEEQSEEVAQWIDAVQENRKAETLDFRPKDRIRITRDEMVGKFEPSTDFEKEMSQALEEAGAADEREMVKQEEREMIGSDDDGDDLGSNKLSMEEYRKRRGELVKMRALMFYDEQKRHHINKIKSKKYRKIRKKQRLRDKEAEQEDALKEDDELAKELEEKAEFERMKERMSLKHKNTSKWAKRVLRRGGAIDMDTRKALSEQIRVGDDLRKKMLGDGDDDEGGDDNLLEQARSILADTEKEDDTENDKSKGIFQLAFMKKGMEIQRERAKEEARQLLRELEANEDEGGESDDNDDDDDDSNVDDYDNMSEKGNESPTPETEQEEKEKSSEVGTNDGNGDEFVVSTNTNTTESGYTTAISLSTASGSHISNQGVVNIEEAANIASTDDSNTNETSGAKDSDTSKGKKGKKGKNGKNNDEKIATLSQDELVRRAFAAPSDAEIEKEFADEKKMIQDRDEHVKRKKLNDNKSVSGWGSWAGEGAPAPRPPKKLPKKMQAPSKKIKKRKRADDGRKNLIINAKRIKKNTKFQIEDIPHPFTSREQYERAMTGAIGQEWNVTGAVKDMTRPEVVTRAGKMIRPLSKKVKVKRAPAKF